MPTLAAWLHDLDPFVFRITDSFGPRWYGMAYVAGFVVAYFILLWMARRRLTPIPAERAGDAMIIFILGTLIGGRLGYVLVYQPALLWDFHSQFPWWGLLEINRGGMASHGAMIGLFLSAWWVSRGFKTHDGQITGRAPILHIMDVLVLLSPAGLFFGRLANFINGELLGKVISPAGTPGPWWTVQFPQELRDVKFSQLTAEQTIQLKALAESAVPGKPFPDGLEHILHHVKTYATELKPLVSSRIPSQLIQALAEGLVCGAIVWFVAARPRKPGVTAGIWLIAYGILRILTEVWRLPDAQFVVGRPAGLSRGQWLSAAMIGFGILTIIVARASRAAPMLGWRAKSPASSGQAA